MPEKREFDLGDYVEVKDRIRIFYELYGNGRLVTERYELTREPDEKPKVIVEAKAYRTPDDPHPGVGLSWMYLPGGTSYTKGSEIENVETSAWGRAIGSLGILIDKSIASRNEIENKSPEPASRHTAAPDPEKAATRADEPVLVGPWSATGAIQLSKKAPADGLIRESPEGPVLVVAFTDTDNHRVPQVIARGPLAVDLYDAAGDQLNGLVCELSGDLYEVPWWKDDREMKPYERVELRSVRAGSWSLPVAEPPTIPMFEDELDQAVAAI